eukprot:s2419_g1.t2
MRVSRSWSSADLQCDDGPFSRPQRSPSHATVNVRRCCVANDDTLDARKAVQEKEQDLPHVLDGVAYCHAQGLGPIIHRDLQPEFVLVAEAQKDENMGIRGPSSLKAWVTSIGLQPLFDLHGLGGSLPSASLPPSPESRPELAPEALPSSGSPEFLAPEAWRRDYGPKCDVWSCGCLLFLLLTGRPPFLPRKLVTAGAPAPAGVREAVRAMLLKEELESADEIQAYEALSILGGQEAKAGWLSPAEAHRLAPRFLQLLEDRWDRQHFALSALGDLCFHYSVSGHPEESSTQALN